MWLFFLLKSRWWKENRRPPKTGTPRGDAAVSEQQSAELEETLRPQRSVGFVLISTIFVQVDARPAHWVAVGRKLDTTIKKKPASPHTHTMADSWWRSRISFHDNNKESKSVCLPCTGRTNWGCCRCREAAWVIEHIQLWSRLSLHSYSPSGSQQAQRLHEQLHLQKGSGLKKTKR